MKPCSLVLVTVVLLLALPFEGQGALAVTADSVTPNSWSLLFRASIGDLRDSLATIGIRVDATADYDPAYDAPRPPAPPGDYIQLFFPHTGGHWPTMLGTRYASDYTNPSHPVWRMDVESSLPSGELHLMWDTSGLNHLPSGYRVRLSDSVNNIVVNLRTTNSYISQYTGPRSFTIIVEYDAVVMNIVSGWNCLSLPRVVDDSLVATLFPDAISRAFLYDGKYTQSGYFIPGVGYWLKFAHSKIVAVAGTAVPTLTIQLRAGWNLIGSVDHAVLAPHSPVINSSFFGYSGRYNIADTLIPGKAYWVKAPGSGALVLGTGENAPVALFRNPATSGRLAVITADGGAGTTIELDIRRPAAATGEFELPPPPPEGVFDVRFTNQSTVAYSTPGSPAVQSFVFEIRPGERPVGLHCALDDAVIASARLEYRSHGVMCTKIFGFGQDCSVPDADAGPARLVLTASRSGTTESFSIGPVTPNPCNPASVILYTTPVRARVRMTLVSVLGQEVMVLHDAYDEGGHHQIQINAGALGLSSGVYYCRMVAVDQTGGLQYQQTMKIVYVK